MEDITNKVRAMHEDFRKDQERNIRWASLLDHLWAIDEKYEPTYYVSRRHRDRPEMGTFDGIIYVFLPGESREDGGVSGRYSAHITPRSYWSNTDSMSKIAISMRAEGFYDNNNSFRTFIPDTDRKLKNMAAKIHKTTCAWERRAFSNMKEARLDGKLKNIKVIEMSNDLGIPEDKIQMGNYSNYPKYNYGGLLTVSYKRKGVYNISVELEELSPDLVYEARRALYNIQRAASKRKRADRLVHEAMAKVEEKMKEVTKAA